MFRVNSSEETSKPMVQQQQGFFRWLELDWQQLSSSGDVLSRLWNDDLQGVMVHGVYQPEQLSALSRGLESHQPEFLKTWFPDVFRSWFYGRNLNLTGPDLGDYFDEAEQFYRHLQQWSPEFVDRIEQCLSALSGGLSVSAPPGPNAAQRYMFTTLRGHDPQGYIPAHCDNEFFLRPSYSHLAQLCEPHILSYVLSFAAGDAGGATEIFDFKQSLESARLISDDRYGDKPDIAQLESIKIRIPAGSMLIFDSGQYLHRLTPLEGQSRRWTACSFMAKAKQSNEIYCWG
ncbi:MAG: proline hydroxylase [Cellvibrionaceae bacterium]|nr:proline hydroxylase [Cellvibrionaceae bacterium]|tara:strand:- start:5050 stop:5913 length:864 start_codon:yes stop_codon:yes gene_type:complete